MLTWYVVLGTRLDSVMSVVDVVVELHVDTSGTPFSIAHHEMVKEKVKFLKHTGSCSQVREVEVI